MIIADYLKIDQKALKTAFMIAIPLLLLHLFKIDFQLLWRYFPGQIKVSRQFYGLEPFIYTKENPLYYCVSTCFFS
jgi:hypothetical protein